MVKRRSVSLALLLVGCANIWGFDDLEAPPPPAPEVVCSSYVEPCPLGCDPCSLRCVDLSSDAANCGSCGTQCTGGRLCEDGACACEAGTEVCGGLCVDTSSDPTNCGTCGTVCDPGGACNAGACTFPVTLSMGQGTPGPIVVDGSRIYFTGGSTVYSIAKDGTDLVMLTAASVTALALDAANLYLGGSTIASIPLAGGTATTLATLTVQAGAIAVDSTDVYWVDSSSVNKVSLAGGTPTVLTTTSVTSTVIGLDAAGVYFAYSSNVYRTPLAGGSQALIGTAASTVQDLAVDGGTIYLAAAGIRALSLDEGTLETLATETATKLAIDADNVYFFSGTSISRVSRSGGDVTTLAIDPSPRDLAVDGANVYWTSNGASLAGAVMMVAK